jgi:A/G-specific adenine glycosylase
MLQQTRVSAVLPYYERFLARFPTISDLAGASEPELLSAWAGLGYYRRARNMQRAARMMNAAFPRDYDTIRSLPGVGAYTAAAIASIAFGLPHAAVDGNVLRVLSRVTNDAGDLTAGPVKKRLEREAVQRLDCSDPGLFNQAMMELGATVCLPQGPQCDRCPVEDLCAARRAGVERVLPNRGKRQEAVYTGRTLVILVRRGRLLLWQQPPDAPKLAGFWELPEPEHFDGVLSGNVIGKFRHSITNHRYTFEVLTAGPGVSATCKNLANCGFHPLKSLESVALSTTARKAIKLYSATLSRLRNDAIHEPV